MGVLQSDPTGTDVELDDSSRIRGTLKEIGELHLAQEDGRWPSTLVAGSAPGESGVSILRVRFREGAHLRATVRHHLIWFHLSPAMRFECRLAGRGSRHEVRTGSLAICPAGIDCAADAEQGSDVILVAIDPGHFLLAAAEDSSLEAQLIERFTGDDQRLLGLARTLVSESSNHYPNGPLFWNDIASDFIEGLVACHTSGPEIQTRGMLSRDVLSRLREYVVANLDAPIDVSTLAGIAGRSPFHFSRVFTRSVGVSPHRYVVHLRLRRAVALVREGRAGLADIASSTGFADQSHLTRWVRRVYGVPPTQLVG